MEFYCITFLGVIILSIVLNMGLSIFIDNNDENKNGYHGAISGILWVWWLLGYIFTCQEVIGPVLSIA